MNGKDIFLGLNYVGEDLIEEAGGSQRPVQANQKGSRKKIRRPLLLAAIIATMLLLVGCAVVYVLSLNGLKLGDQQVTHDVYDYDPNSGEAVSYVGQETKTQQVLTLAGLDGTPASQAAREWYAFLEAYDPDGAIQKAVWGKEPDFGEEYYGYGLYTQEMKDKLDEILAKYDLKLRGRRVEFKTSKLLFRALGMENVLNSGSEAQMRIDHAAYYENGDLDVYFTIMIPGADGGDPRKTNGYLYYRPKDCFIPDTAVLADAQWEEWNYTTASGDPVLILRSEEASSAWILCDMPNHTASLRLDIIRMMAVERGGIAQEAKFDPMSKAQLEQVADAVDFSLEPKLVDGWENLSDGAVPAGQEINGYKIEPVSAFTDGYGYRIILRITAPEGIALTDPDDHNAGIQAGDGVWGYCEEDGDGKLNTCHYILSDAIQKSERPEDGSFPYPQGNVIPVYWEDLYFSRFDFEKFHSVTTLLTEGTWKFNIPLSEADTRQIELLTQPITAKGCIGFRLGGEDVLEDFEITSIKLRSLGIDLTCENSSADFHCFNGQWSRIVRKDGSTMEFPSGSFDQPIDLDQVAYVQLADKTIIPMPGVDEETVALLSEALSAQPEEGDVLPVYEDGVELVSQPVTLKNLAGYATDATGDVDPLYEYFTLSSFVLHPQGAVAQDRRALAAPDTVLQVIMKDGSQILLTNSGCGLTAEGTAFSTFQAEAAIALEKVDHVLLPDGTVLPLPPT